MNRVNKWNKPVIRMDMAGNIKRYDNVDDASRDSFMDPNRILTACGDDRNCTWKFA